MTPPAPTTIPEPAPAAPDSLDAAWADAEALIPAGLVRAIAIGEYPPEYERAGEWTALLSYAHQFYGNGPTPTAALRALAQALRDAAREPLA